MQHLGCATCNPNITSIIRTPKNKFETNSFLIPWKNAFIDFVNDDNLFRIVVIKMFLPTTSSYCDFTHPVRFLDQTEVIWIDRRFTLSPAISGVFNALPICDSRTGHLSNGLWGSLGDMKPFRPFILGLKSHLYPWGTQLWRLIFHGDPLNYIRQFQSPHGHMM